MIRSKTQHDRSTELLLGNLTAEFLDRVARGENPQVEEYGRRHPDIADLIGDIFPILDLIKHSEGERTAEHCDASIDPRTHQQLGDFRIVREIGRGGMGVVYEAQQLSMPRKVALKVLPFMTLADEKRLQRFTNEVHAAATLDHPNIVSVYSVGEERGVHYYAMQLVRGPSLASVIEDLRSQADDQGVDGDSIHHAVSSADVSTRAVANRDEPPQGTLSPSYSTDQGTQPKAAASTIATSTQPEFYQSVAALGIQVAEALEHAHAHGIVHRDIKPANVMLDAQCKPYITDFGLARIGADSDMTMTGDVVGTLRYMSPEQALAKSGSVDQRTDIYSLGVTLYEIITRHHAFDGRDREELLKQIAFEEPAPPRHIDRNIPRDLETILLKAMAKEPEDRYDTAQDLQEDLGRILKFRPISARRPTLSDRGCKLVRRHAAIVGLMCLLLFVTTIGAITGALLVAHERDMANHEKELSEAHLNTARQAIDSLLVGMADELENAPAATNIQRKLLENALNFYQNFPQEVLAKPEIRYEMALAFQRAGDIHGKLGGFADRSKAFELYKNAVAIYRKLVVEHPAIDEYRLGLAKSYRSQAGILNLERIKHSESASQLCQQSVNLLEDLFTNNPQNPVFQRELANTLLAQYGCFSREDEDARREAISKAVRLMRDLAEKFLGNHHYANDLSSALAVYSGQLARDSEYEQAESVQRESMSISQQLVDNHPKNQGYRRSLVARSTFLAIFLRDRGLHEESDDVFAKSIREQEELIRDYPAMRDLKAFMVHTLGNHWESLLARRMLPEARQTWELFLKHQRAMIEYENNPRGGLRFLVKNLNAYGTILHELGELKLAQEAWQESLTLARKLAIDNPESKDDQGWLAWISVTCPYPELRDVKEAASAAAKAVELDEDGADVFVVSGWCQYRLGYWQMAVEEFNRAKGGYQATHEADRELGLAATKWHMGREKEAVEHYNRGKQLLEQDDRSGTAPYVSRRLSAEVGQMLAPDYELQNRDEVDAH